MDGHPTAAGSATGAAERWRALVRARLDQLDQLAPGRGALGAAFWDSRAPRFAAQTCGTGGRDPFLRLLRPAVGHRTTVLDVGAGAGRFALPLAARARQVVAVDPSRQMLAILQREARRQGLDNVRCLLGRWEDVDPGPADVALCSYVLPLVEDAPSFLRKLDAAAHRRVFVYLPAASTDLLMDPLWRHFHGEPRRLGPTYLDAVAVLAELGIQPRVQVVEAPVVTRFASLRQAVEGYRDVLVLPDTVVVRRELRALLSDWLVGKQPALRPPLRSAPGAVLSWARAEPAS
ncbi:MAG TPA: class I SAM-dependent methyltransferase [Egibacteraceae bacterium]|nr:class I SAM-dependent methyltransferase [Egibacteraceae bacterium]